jgi:hypothetical protein
VLYKLSGPSKCIIFKMMAPLLNRMVTRGVLTTMKCPKLNRCLRLFSGAGASLRTWRNIEQGKRPCWLIARQAAPQQLGYQCMCRPAILNSLPCRTHPPVWHPLSCITRAVPKRSAESGGEGVTYDGALHSMQQAMNLANISSGTKGLRSDLGPYG